LERNGFKAAMLHGDRTQPQRQRVRDRFGKGEVTVVAATDVASRGLHIPAVNTVVNYDIPPDPEQYVHRIGRAAHGEGKGGTASEGIAVTLLSGRDIDRWERIVDVTGITPEMLERFGEDPASGKVDALLARLETAEERRKRGKRTRSGRSRAAAPIKKADKPGGGVRRLEP
ncbi:MAG: helicase-related protein, partial [Planctomycetota bacterium]